jgi:hypothetical protein
MKSRYLGFAFDFGKVGHPTHYGWARVTTVHSEGDNYPHYFHTTVTGYAYQTIPNKAIITGKTKGEDVITIERGTLGALALGRK